MLRSIVKGGHMTSMMEQLEVEVACPDCLLSFEIPLAVIENSQRLLAERGFCTGLASFECPAPYFAALATPDTIAQVKCAALDTTEEELERWENEGGAAEASDKRPRTPRRDGSTLMT